jgi:hypothetical protein
VLLFDIEIEECFENKDRFDDSQLKPYDGKERTYELSDHNDQIAKYLEGYQTKHVFYDPVVEYIIGFFSLNVQLCLHCENQKYHELPFLLHVPVLTMFQHSQGVKLLEQLLDWLYWHFSIT